MNSLSVLFRDGNSFSYFSRKLFEIGAYANSLDCLDCSHGILGVFYNAVVILTVSISDCLCLATLDEIRMNSLSILF